MQNETITGHRHPRAEGGEVAVHPGDHVAFVIGRRQHDGVAGHRKIPLWAGCPSMLRVDFSAKRSGIRLRQQLRERHGREIRIRVVLIQVGVREFFGLDQEMPVQGILRSQRCKSPAGRPYRHARLQNVQDLVRRPGLCRRRKFEDVVAMILRARGLNPFALVAGQILGRHRPAECLGLRHDGLRNLSFVERVRAFRLQQAQCSRKIRISEDLSGLRPHPIHIPGLDRIGIRRSTAGLQRQRIGQPPVMCDALGNRKSALRILRRRFEHLFES